MTRIGIISFEHMHALSYANALNENKNVEFVGISDTDHYRGTNLASRLGTNFFADYRDLLKQNLDGVIICTNNRDHRQMVIAASEHGVPSLVEKPFAISLNDAKAMLEAAKSNDVFIMNALPMRYNPSVIAGKKAIDNGEIGEILSITSINHGKIPNGWFLDEAKSGGGALIDHTVHLADIIRWYTGSEYKSVYCESGELIHGKGVEDCGIAFTEMENGVLATIDFSWAHHANYPIWPQVDLEVIGTKGVLNVKGFAQVHHVVDAQNNQVYDKGWNSNGDEGLVDEFVSACANKIGVAPTGEDGARSTELAIAAYESSKTKKVVNVVKI